VALAIVWFKIAGSIREVDSRVDKWRNMSLGNLVVLVVDLKAIMGAGAYGAGRLTRYREHRSHPACNLQGRQFRQHELRPASSGWY
jgi:hypothetical protein